MSLGLLMGTAGQENFCDLQNMLISCFFPPPLSKSDVILTTLSVEPDEVGKHYNYLNKSGQNKTFTKIIQVLEGIDILGFDILGLNCPIPSFFCFLLCLHTSEVT